eukprot:1530949-Prymnesium_polylepis.1
MNEKPLTHPPATSVLGRARARLAARSDLSRRAVRCHTTRTPRLDLFNASAVALSPALSPRRPVAPCVPRLKCNC